MSLIQIKKLRRTYHIIDDMQLVKSQHLFHSLDMNIDQGEFVSVVGPSGSGKTTLLNIIGCLDSISDSREVKIRNGHGEQKIKPREGSGEVSIKGQDITKLRGNHKADFMNKEIGFIFQFHHLIPELTALENVALPLRIAGKSKREAQGRALEQLTRLDMKANASKKPSILSGGEKQRVAIARALANEPTILLADEPTGSLHPNLKQEIMQIFIDLNREGLTIMMVTHDIELILDKHQNPLVGRFFDLGLHQKQHQNQDHQS